MSVPSRGPILVVEDDQQVRAAIVETLEDEGFCAAAVADGAAALEWLRVANPRPSVILLDLMMPVMNGFEFREEQTKDPALASIPVVVLTAYATTETTAASLGAAAFLRKPVKLAALLDVVERFAVRTESRPS